MNTFLVIRCSNLDGVNPITEVNEVIARLGYCWFGKYGQPLSKTGATKTDPLRGVVLVGNSTVAAPGRGSLYVLGGWSFSKPSNPGGYPAYYEKKLGRISTWVKLIRADTSEVSISDLQVKSSLQPLARALSDSMRGHFWCIRS